jgi:hypothetical protein
MKRRWKSASAAALVMTEEDGEAPDEPEERSDADGHPGVP